MRAWDGTHTTAEVPERATQRLRGLSALDEMAPERTASAATAAAAAAPLRPPAPSFGRPRRAAAGDSVTSGAAAPTASSASARAPRPRRTTSRAVRSSALLLHGVERAFARTAGRALDGGLAGCGYLNIAHDGRPPPGRTSPRPPSAGARRRALAAGGGAESARRGGARRLAVGHVGGAGLAPPSMLTSRDQAQGRGGVALPRREPRARRRSRCSSSGHEPSSRRSSSTTASPRSTRSWCAPTPSTSSSARGSPSKRATSRRSARAPSERAWQPRAERARGVEPRRPLPVRSQTVDVFLTLARRRARWRPTEKPQTRSVVGRDLPAMWRASGSARRTRRLAARNWSYSGGGGWRRGRRHRRHRRRLVLVRPRTSRARRGIAVVGGCASCRDVLLVGCSTPIYAARANSRAVEEVERGLEPRDGRVGRPPRDRTARPRKRRARESSRTVAMSTSARGWSPVEPVRLPRRPLPPRRDQPSLITIRARERASSKNPFRDSVRRASTPIYAKENKKSRRLPTGEVPDRMPRRTLASPGGGELTKIQHENALSVNRASSPRRQVIINRPRMSTKHSERSLSLSSAVAPPRPGEQLQRRRVERLPTYY